MVSPQTGGVTGNAASPGKLRSGHRPRLGRLGREFLGRFTLFVLLVLIVMSASSIYAAWRQVQDLRKLQGQIATWSVNAIDLWYQELANNLKAACQDPTVMSASSGEIEAHLRQVLTRSPTFRNVTLVDARPGNRGAELLHVQGDEVSSGANYYGEEWFYPALTGERYVSSVLYRNGEPAIVLAQVIKEDGQAIGVMAAEVDVSWAYSLLKQYSWEERGSYIYVVDRQGRPIVHGDSSISVQQSYINEIEGIHRAVIRQDMPSFYRGLNHSREWVIGAYQPSEEVHWLLIAEQPLPWIVQNLLPLGGAAAGVLALSALAGLVVGLYISRRVAQPIVYLREGAQRIGAGDLERRIALSGRNELADLAAEFNQMAENLQASQSRQEAWSLELEERVTQRTSELSLAIQQLQQEAEIREGLIRTIREMSSPVIPVMKEVLVIPLIGTLDSERAHRVMSDLLEGIERNKARAVILDITGLAMMDSAVANALLQSARAAQLLGAQPILVGIAPGVAETLVHLGVDLHDLYTAANLQEGLQLALKLVHR